jgi:hypothetical protein
MEFIKDNPQKVASVPLTSRLDYPALPLPSYERNDLFITFHSAEIGPESTLKRSNHFNLFF